MEEELLNLFVPSTGSSCLPGTVGGAGETVVDGPAWSLPLHRFSSGMQPPLYYHSACNSEPFVFLLLVKLLFIMTEVLKYLPVLH